MKVVRKLLAPLLVVGILLTSLISLHQLKADKHGHSPHRVKWLPVAQRKPLILISLKSFSLTFQNSVTSYYTTFHTLQKSNSNRVNVALPYSSTACG